MVAYGSDYLLATAGCAPEAFAARDRAWRAGAPVGFELNDALQALGALLYRDADRRRPARRAAMAAGARRRSGWPRRCPASPPRPDSDLALYRELAARLDSLLASTDAPDLAARASAVTAS